MAILIKLLPISSVASNLRGLSLSAMIFALATPPSFSRLTMSCGEREKKATSDADIKAENNNKTNNRIINPLREAKEDSMGANNSK